MRWLLAGMAALMQGGVVAETGIAPFRFGEFEVIAVQDAPSSMRRELFPALEEKEFRRLAGERGAVASVNVFLLRRDGKNILVDTGNGGARGHLAGYLEKLGIAPAKIDLILLSHMHGDHIGGLLDAQGNAVFPKALVYVSAPERDYWAGAAGGGGNLVRKVLQAYGDRMRTFRFEEEVIPGIRALDASGHTPGHTVFATDSMLIVGDLLHAAAIQMRYPEVSATYDMDPEKAARVRRRFLEQAVDSAQPVAGMHLPFPGIGRVIRDGKAYSFAPVQ